VTVRSPPNSVLLTDLYQLTMLHGYFRQVMQRTAVFEFMVRELPPQRNFLLAAGLAPVLDYLEELHFDVDELAWLADNLHFEPDFIDFLGALRFSGEVHAMAEGVPFFPHEPVLRVTAPLPQAQLVESRIINLLHLHTLLASKAVRSVLAAPDRTLVDFGLRRAHGAEAGLAAARSTFLAGFAGSATVLAGPRYGIPLFGTMAHSFVQCHPEEIQAFEHFARAEPGNVILLIDTYDTERGARRVLELAPRLAELGIRIKGVRLDSGDLAQHARQVRAILDAGGLGEAMIFCSGNLDEYRLRELVEGGAPIGGFGIGTKLDTSADAPYLDCAYKIQEYAGVPLRKRSEGKATWPGRKQVYRRYGPDGRACGDTVSLDTETVAGEPLLQSVMQQGRRLGRPEQLQAIRERVALQVKRLPPPLLGLDQALPPYPVEISPALRRLAAEVDRRIG
jgi:nicotinate phosphoribosyltransferase